MPVVFSRKEFLMRAYVITTGVVFAIFIAVHVLRAIQEGPQLLKEPPFTVYHNQLRRTVLVFLPVVAN